MHTVYLQRHTDYADKSRLKEIFLEGLSSINKTSFYGKKILIKPNFLMPSQPEKAVITHPLFLMALIELLKDIGAETYIGDSPGLGSLQGVIEKSGLTSFLKHTGTHIAAFSKTVQVKTKKPLVFREFELPKVLFEVDEIINVPKLKTHQMMVLTLAVKNLYGCINGLKKVKLHLTAGQDYETFASLLLDLYGVINPGINIIDGIEGMEGDGPSSGDLRKFGIIAVSDNALALDLIMAKILGVNPDNVPYLKVARKQAFKDMDENNVNLTGIPLNEFAIRPIKLPKSFRSDFAVPKFLKRFAKNYLFSHPYVTAACESCGVCKKHCPAGAITLKEKAVIDKAKCIRCYCCQELCEYNSIKVKRGIW